MLRFPSSFYKRICILKTSESTWNNGNKTLLFDFGLLIHAPDLGPFALAPLTYCLMIESPAGVCLFLPKQKQTLEG